MDVPRAKKSKKSTRHVFFVLSNLFNVFFCCVDRRLELCECSWNLDFRLKFKVVERCQHVPCLVRLYTSTWSWPKTHGGIGIFELKQKSLAL